VHMVAEVKNGLSPEMRAAHRCIAATGHALGLRFESRLPSNFGSSSYNIHEVSGANLSTEQLRMFGRYLSIGTGTSVELVMPIDGRELYIEKTPSNVAIQSAFGQLSSVSRLESGVAFLSAKVLAMTTSRVSCNEDEHLLQLVRGLGFSDPVVTIDAGARTLQLKETEGVFGEERFCRLLGELGKLSGSQIVVKLLCPKEALGAAATELGLSLVPGVSLRGPSFIDLCTTGAFNKREFFARTGLLPNVLGQRVSEHAVLRDFVLTEIGKVRDLVRTWWVEGDKFYVHLRGDSYRPHRLYFLKRPLQRLGYELQVDSGATRGRGIIAEPAADQLFIGAADWASDLPLIVKQHIGLQSRLKVPGVNGYQGSPRLCIFGGQREYTALIHRVAATIAESVVPFPIEVLCREEPTVVELRELNKLVCIGAPQNVFVHYSSIDSKEAPAIVASVVGEGEVALERIYGDRLNVELRVLRSGLNRKRLLECAEAGGDFNVDAPEYVREQMHRIGRISANLIRERRDVVCLILGELSPGVYKAYLQAVGGMGLFVGGAGAHGSGSWVRASVSGFSKALKCPVLSGREGQN
jgi:hypothetical protein